MDVAVGAEQGKFRGRGEESYLADQLATSVSYFGVADGFGSVGKNVAAAPLALTLARDFLRRKARLGALSGRQLLPAAVRRIAMEALAFANSCIFTSSGSNDDFVAGGISVATVLIAGHHAFVAHVGDARVYLVRRGVLERLTTDDAVGLEAVPSASAATTADIRPRSLLWRTLGTQPKLEAAVAHLELLAGDKLFLCTSGMHRTLEDEETSEILGRSSNASEALGALLVTSRMRAADDGGAAVVAFDPIVPLREGTRATSFVSGKHRQLIVIALIAALVGALYLLRGVQVAH